jgi:hypothetical protein
MPEENPVKNCPRFGKLSAMHGMAVGLDPSQKFSGAQW